VNREGEILPGVVQFAFRGADTGTPDRRQRRVVARV
jgi:hypothetical protein